MHTLPTEYDTLFAQVQPYFSRRIWKHAKTLLIGAILAPGKRTISSILHIMGLSNEKHFQNYHRVLNRAVWSSLGLSKQLLILLLKTFSSDETIVIGIDETIERRRGKKIRARGIYRDPVRSSKSHFVKTSGLRWISMMLLVNIPWAMRIWALPFFTVLAPSKGYYEGRLRKHKKLTDWARLMGTQVRRWLPNQRIMLVADSSYAVLTLLHQLLNLKKPVYMVTQLRLDAALYEPVLKPRQGAIGRPRKKGARLPSLKDVLVDEHTAWQRVTVNNWYGKGPTVVEITSDTAIWYHSGKPVVPLRWVLVRDPKGIFESRALLCTDQAAHPIEILQWFVSRWQVEVTFQEVRTHLGVETQRQWSDKAIARSTPVLLALFSWVTLLAHQSQINGQLPIRKAAWYTKAVPTFSDAIALVRRRIWEHSGFSMSPYAPDIQKPPYNLLNRMFEALCYSF
ncbi:MAG: transposase [Anaerolineaceae bacterium]|jgi:hypothetical protein|nr:transposase [Anaerolineaceae bacterium]